MWADVLARPMQGKTFKEMRAALMNCKVDYSEDSCNNERLMEGRVQSELMEISLTHHRNALGAVPNCEMVTK